LKNIHFKVTKHVTFDLFALQSSFLTLQLQHFFNFTTLQLQPYNFRTNYVCIPIYSYPIVTANSNAVILIRLSRFKMARTKQTPKRTKSASKHAKPTPNRPKQALDRYECHKAKLYQPKPTPARVATNA
jgi:amino acid permease